MDDNRLLLKFACDYYCAGHLDIIGQEATAFVSGGISSDTQVESLHRMRTSSRRIIEITDAYNRFIQQKSGKNLSKSSRLLLKYSGALRNLDVLLIIVHNIQQTENRNEDEIAHLEDFRLWLLQQRKIKASELCECLDKDVLHMINRSAVRLELKFAIGYDHKSTVCHSLREAAAAIYYRSAADILAAGSSRDQLHALRIKCKGFRYLLELFELSGMDTYQAQSEFKVVQDIFGSWHDDHVLLQNLKKYRKEIDHKKDQNDILHHIFVEREKLSRSKAEEAANILTQQWFDSAFASVFLGQI
ncbi:MAG: CHAD domain-containing protein [Clostridiaceae bacterium]|nr:CHAD domain-containing protein [Clostridiaceae bacterium]